MRFAAALLGLLAVLAGCFGGAGDADDGPDPSQGFVRGVVVDGALRPVEGASVVLSGAQTRESFTGTDGLFQFGPLPVGAYPVAVTKDGYVGAQFTADAVPEGAPAAVAKIVLERLASSLPYVETFVFEGYIECGTSSAAVCAIPNFVTLAACDTAGQCVGNVTNDKFNVNHVPEGLPAWVQSELVWTATVDASDQFYFSVSHYTIGEESELETVYNSTTGPSPLLLTVGGDQANESSLGITEGYRASVFSGAIAGTTPPGCAPPCVGPGFAVQQRFTIYTHFFYHYQPPPGWRFTDSDVPLPPLHGA